MLPDSKENELGRSTQEASQSAGKTIGVVLVPCHIWKCTPTAVSGDVDISEIPRCHFIITDEFLLQGSFWLNEVVISKVCKPDNFDFESHNSLKLSFTNIRGSHSNFVGYESFLEPNSPDILALCETNLDNLFGSSNFSVRCNLPLIPNDSVADMHGFTFYGKEDFLLFGNYL